MNQVSSSGSPPPSPPTPNPPRPKNLGTMLPQHLPNWDHVIRNHAIRATDAYEIAVAADRARPAPTEIGYRLYWMRQGFLASHEVPASPDGYVVIGRHTSCDVVIDDERAVSLRHVLVRCTSTDDGEPILSVLDLRTNEGFELSDGTKQHSIAATGPVVFRIGIHAIVALPSHGTFPDKLPVPQVDRQEERAKVPANRPNVIMQDQLVAPVPSAPSSPKPSSQLLGPSSRAVSRITLMPMSVDLSQRRSVWPGEPAPFSAVPGGEPYLYEVALEPHGNSRRRAIVRLTGADLDHGVLIGRADKCVDEGLRAILSENISRVHVLLVRDKGVCRLYDIASMNGTYVGNGKVRCIPLADEGTTVTLLRSGGATLHWKSLVVLQ